MPVASCGQVVVERLDSVTACSCGVVRSFLEESSPLYPDILKWWDRRVMPGIVSGERVCHVASQDGQLTGVCIGKRHARSAKLCTLRVREGARGYGVGQELLHAALQDLLVGGTEKIHFTISEGILRQCGVFFAPYGFKMLSWSKGRYVSGMDELVFEADKDRVVRGVGLRKVRWGLDQKVVISIQPRYGRLIEEGRKRATMKRAKNVRRTRSLMGNCFSCRFSVFSHCDGGRCRRRGGPVFRSMDSAWLKVCDRFMEHFPF